MLAMPAGKPSQTAAILRDIDVFIPRKPYIREICPIKFARRPDMTNHIRVLTGETPSEYDICDRRYAQSQSLRAHTRSNAKGDADVNVSPVGLR